MKNKKTSEYSKIFQMEFVPILRWMDYGGLEKKLKSLSKRTNEFLQALIDEQRRKEWKLENVLRTQEWFKPPN